MDTVKVVAGVLRNEEGALLLVRRGPSMAHPGCWEFPGGKVEADETLFTALKRELEEELHLQIETGIALWSDVLEHDGCVLEIHFVEGRITAGSMPILTEHDALQWLAPDQVTGLKLAPGDVRFAAHVAQLFSVA